MTLAAACLSTLRFLRSCEPFSAAWIFSKYCFTRANSRKTGCSLALTPLSRRKAVVASVEFEKAKGREYGPRTEEYGLDRVRQEDVELGFVDDFQPRRRF